MSKKCFKWNKKCSQTKFVTNRTRIAWKQKMCFYGTLWCLIVVFASYGLVWPCMALYGLALLLLFTAIAICGLIQFRMEFCDMV